MVLNQTGENLIRDQAERLSAKNDCTESLQVMEQRMICQVMAKTSGDIRQAARILGIGRTTLYRRLVKYKGTLSLRENPNLKSNQRAQEN
jgi:transcriptional regulator of acetoin/glycerol metabolism